MIPCPSCSQPVPFRLCVCLPPPSRSSTTPIRRSWPTTSRTGVSSASIPAGLVAWICPNIDRKQGLCSHPARYVSHPSQSITPYTHSSALLWVSFAIRTTWRLKISQNRSFRLLPQPSQKSSIRPQRTAGNSLYSFMSTPTPSYNQPSLKKPRLLCPASQPF